MQFARDIIQILYIFFYAKKVLFLLKNILLNQKANSIHK